MKNNIDNFISIHDKIGKTKDVYPTVQITFDTIVIFKDKKYGNIARKCIVTGHYDIYENIPFEGMLKSLKELVKDSVEKGKYIDSIDIILSDT